MFVFRKVIFDKWLSRLSCVCLSLWKLVNGKHFLVKEKFGLVFRKVFSWKIWAENVFPEVVKNLKISYYLLIISNLVLKLLIAIYTLFWIFIFQFRLLKFNFYINYGPHFYNCYLFFPYYFFIEIFYLSNLILILLIVTYFFEIIYEMLIIIILISSSFIFFYFLDLISIILIIIYFIWDNLWNYDFFQFYSHSTF